MNTADITCGQLTERTKTINNQHSDLNAELEVLAEVKDKCCCNWWSRNAFLSMVFKHHKLKYGWNVNFRSYS